MTSLSAAVLPPTDLAEGSTWNHIRIRDAGTHRGGRCFRSGRHRVHVCGLKQNGSLSDWFWISITHFTRKWARFTWSFVRFCWKWDRRCRLKPLLFNWLNFIYINDFLCWCKIPSLLSSVLVECSCCLCWFICVLKVADFQRGWVEFIDVVVIIVEVIGAYLILAAGWFDSYKISNISKIIFANQNERKSYRLSKTGYKKPCTR